MKTKSDYKEGAWVYYIKSDGVTVPRAVKSLTEEEFMLPYIQEQLSFYD
ncbi:MAG: hypothetical protein H7843_15770 [Nitrospirota bacterium]